MIAPSIEAAPDAHDVQALQARVDAGNIERTNANDRLPLASFARDESGAMVAGISGATWAGICEIGLLWVREDVRRHGFGSRLLAAAEREAQRRGCSVVMLTTFSFQAPGFYQQHGYQIAGTIPDCPHGHTNYLFMKRL